MKKVISIFTLLIFLVSGLKSQISVSLGTTEFDAGANGAVDIRVSGFRSVLTAQFSLNWDSTKFDFVSVTNINTTVPGFDMESFGLPRSGNIRNGQVTLAWFDSGGATLADNSRLFTLNLRAKNQPCATSDLAMTSTPRQILFASTMNDPSGNPLIYTHTAPAGKLSIKGTNCGGGGGGGTTTELEITAGTVQAQPGTKVCVPITVKNYTTVEGGAGTIKWNPAVLSFSGIENNQVPRNFSGNENSKNIGLYSFIFDDPSAPKTFPDGTKIFDVCFNVIGQAGVNSNIELTNDLTDWDFRTGGKSVNPKRNNGRVTVVTSVRPPVQLIAAKVNGNEGSTTCVDITVKGFTSVTAVEFGLEWDPVQLEYVSVGGFNLPGLNNDAFNRPTNRLMRFSYSPANTQPVTLADDTRIFNVCFKVLGKCADQGTANINFVPSIVVGNEAGAALPFQTTAGSIRTNACGGGPGTCTLVSVKNVSCAGGNDGGINVTVSPTEGCNCVWKKDGAVVQTNPATNCNLTSATAGNYILELTCNGVVSCSLTQAITAPAAITLDGNVVNETCAGKGSITLTATGGTPAYTYAWSNQATTKDITNLSAGSFTVTITDSKNCTATREFTVTNTANVNLEATGTSQNIKCFGETNGSVTLNVTGGCPDNAGNYSYTWSGPTAAQGRTPANLAAGQYSVTIMDSSNPSKSITRSFTIAGPAAAISTTEQITTNSITVTIAGGTAPFTTKWSGGPTAVADNVLNPTGLQGGTYNLNITDAQGCSFAKAIVVGGGGGPLSVGTIAVTSAASFGGFGVSCNGQRNGAVSGMISGGTAPYTVSYSGAASGNANVTNNSFTAINLAPGAYTFRVTDAAGVNATGTVTITEPARITIVPNLTCSDGPANNGGASVQVAGGAGDYKFRWSNGVTTPTLSNVGKGNYSVIIEDKNGCQLPYTARIMGCNEVDICYSGLSIITPNGDGANDVFLINCVRDFPSRLRIYDRFGMQVYEQPGYDNSWNGVNSAGEQLPEGAYMWVLIVDSPNGRENYNGTLTILRD
jgi:gliding motility-associated-like protein